MIRLLVLLFVGMFATLMIAGEDHGQKRYGLMLADAEAAKAASLAAAAPPTPEVKTVFVPSPTVMQPIEAAVQQAAAAPEQIVIEPPQPQTELAAATPEPTLPAPEIPGGKLFTVASKGANVRQGPGTDYAVLDSLVAGEQVLVVEDGAVLEGWSKVRLEGDGVEGYIASRLLLAAE